MVKVKRPLSSSEKQMDDPNTGQNNPSASSSSKGKECAALGCSNTFYGPDNLPTPCPFLKFPKDTWPRKQWLT